MKFSQIALLFLVAFFPATHSIAEAIFESKQSSEIKIENTPLNPSQWHIGLELGFATDNENVLGGSGQVGVGRKIGEGPLRIDLFYRYSIAVTPDLGLLGGGLYQNHLLGTTLDVDLIPSSKNDFRVGVKAGRTWVDGVRGILFIPYALDSFQGWAVGPIISYTHMLSNWVGLGFRTDFLIHLPESNSNLPSFKTLDAAFLLEIRP